MSKKHTRRELRARTQTFLRAAERAAQRVLRGRCVDGEDAGDLAQVAWIRARDAYGAETATAWRDAGALGATVGRRVAIERLRNARRRSELRELRAELFAPSGRVASPAVALELSELVGVVERSLGPVAWSDFRDTVLAGESDLTVASRRGVTLNSVQRSRSRGRALARRWSAAPGL